MKFCCEALRICAVGGGSAVCLLVASDLSGQWGGCMDAVWRAVAITVRRLVRFVPSWCLLWRVEARYLLWHCT